MSTQAIHAENVQVVVISGFGKGEISLSDSGSAHVEGALDGDEARILTQGTVLKLLLPWGRGNRNRLTLAIPQRTALHVDGGSVELTARVRLGHADVRTGSGDVGLTEVGVARISTGSGSIHLDRVAQLARVRSGSGDIFIGQCGGRVMATSGSGSISVGTFEPPAEDPTDDVKMASTWGDVDVRTASGDVQVGIPEGVAAWLDLRAHRGWVEVELDDTDEPDDEQPTVAVRAVTASGGISVRRSAAYA